MYPVLTFYLGGNLLQVSSYTVFALLAVICIICTAPLFLRYAGLSWSRGFILSAGVLVIFFLGARLLNVIVNPSYYDAGGIRPYTLSMSGFSLYGGLLPAGLFIWLSARFIKHDFYAIADALVFPCGVAFILSRMGCFLNGCCAGKVTDAPWGVVFPDEITRMHKLRELFWFVPEVSQSVHPTQLYELIAALIGLIFAALLYTRRSLPKGCVFLFYGLWFTACRLLILPLRVLPYSRIVTDVAYPAMYIILLLAGGFLTWKRLRKHAVQKDNTAKDYIAYYE